MDILTSDDSGALLNVAGDVVTKKNFDTTAQTYLSILLGKKKSIVIEVPLDLMYTDEAGNKFIQSIPLDGKGSLFIMTMTVPLSLTPSPFTSTSS